MVRPSPTSDVESPSPPPEPPPALLKTTPPHVCFPTPVPFLPIVETVVEDVLIYEEATLPDDDFEAVSMFEPSTHPSSLTTEPPLVNPLVEHVAAGRTDGSRDADELTSIFDDIPMQPFDSVIPQCSLLDLENLPPSPTCVRHFPTPTDVFVTPSGLPLDIDDDTNANICIEDLEMSSFVHVPATAMIEGKHPDALEPF